MISQAMFKNGLFLGLALIGCTHSPAHVPQTAPAEETTHADATDSTSDQASAITRRPFDPQHNGKPIIAGISYGPFRDGQKPGGPNPTNAQIIEDLTILSARWHMLRVYSSRAPTEDILRIIRDNDLPLVVMVGVWIAPDSEQDNRQELDSAIRLANAYPQQVAAVSVGNETQVYWSGHRSSVETLIDGIRLVRGAIPQPVTTADDYNFWNKPISHAVAAEIDFLLLHAYAMWNQQSLSESVTWTAAVVESIEATHPDLPIVMGETGWATTLNEEGSEIQYIKAPAGEDEQLGFYTDFTTWAHAVGQPYFYFEAFDEPWKGGDDPRDVEKHWGLYRVDRTPKRALTE